MHYTRNDDGKVIDGKIVVWLERARPGGLQEAADSRSGHSANPSAANKPTAREQEQLAAAAARSLVAAAQNGVPFCEECEAARRKLAAQKA